MNSFKDIEQRYGQAAAYHLLSEIEKAAQIVPQRMTGIDPETRYRKAILAQDYQYAQASLRAAA